MNTPSSLPSRRLSIAPMLDWTDRHCRRFYRELTQDTWLYTEMVTTGALLFGDVERHLRFNEEEHPVALQLGGSEPDALAKCAKLGQEWGYDEINLNCGCPSERVQKGAFGACLMNEAQLVADCIKAMQDIVDIDVTVKHRIGIDYQENYAMVRDFVGVLYQVGCRTFIVHARNAVLKGLSPKQNREIPPLRYDVVYQLKKDFPDSEIIINGGITSYTAIDEQLKHVDGVMIGREAYHNPYFLAEFDQRYYNKNSPPNSRGQIINAMVKYAEQQLALFGEGGNPGGGLKLNSITRHMLGLVNGLAGARQFRQTLSNPDKLAKGDASLLFEAFSCLENY